MIYYGARASRYYLHQLEHCRRSSTAHETVSVVGGMAFLHAVGPLTKALYLVDTDPDTIAFSNDILRLIKECVTLNDFVKHLQVMLPKDKVIYGEHGLETGKFYWHVGRYNFASEEQYTRLRKTLDTIPVNVLCSNLAEFDYHQLQYPSNVLVSNAEGPLGVDGDRILPQILKTASVPVTYVSWIHTICIEPNPYKHSYDVNCDL